MVLAAGDQGVEGVGDVAGGFAGDLDPVMAEEGLKCAVGMMGGWILGFEPERLRSIFRAWTRIR